MDLPFTRCTPRRPGGRFPARVLPGPEARAAAVLLLLLGAWAASPPAAFAEAPVLRAPDAEPLLDGAALLAPVPADSLAPAAWASARSRRTSALRERNRTLLEREREWLETLDDLRRRLRVPGPDGGRRPPPPPPTVPGLLREEAVDSLLEAGVRAWIRPNGFLLAPATLQHLSGGRELPEAGIGTDSLGRGTLPLPDSLRSRMNPYPAAAAELEALLEVVGRGGGPDLREELVERRTKLARKAYRRENWGEAHRHFLALERWTDRRSPALAHYAGEAAFALGDTAAARAGWRRSLAAPQHPRSLASARRLLAVHPPASHPADLLALARRVEPLLEGAEDREVSVALRLLLAQRLAEAGMARHARTALDRLPAAGELEEEERQHARRIQARLLLEEGRTGAADSLLNLNPRRWEGPAGLDLALAAARRHTARGDDRAAAMALARAPRVEGREVELELARARAALSAPGQVAAGNALRHAERALDEGGPVERVQALLLAAHAVERLPEQPPRWASLAGELAAADEALTALRQLRRTHRLGARADSLLRREADLPGGKPAARATLSLLRRELVLLAGAALRTLEASPTPALPPHRRRDAPAPPDEPGLAARLERPRVRQVALERITGELRLAAGGLGLSPDWEEGVALPGAWNGFPTPGREDLEAARKAADALDHAALHLVLGRAADDLFAEQERPDRSSLLDERIRDRLQRLPARGGTTLQARQRSLLKLATACRTVDTGTAAGAAPRALKLLGEAAEDSASPARLRALALERAADIHLRQGGPEAAERARVLLRRSLRRLPHSGLAERARLLLPRALLALRRPAIEEIAPLAASVDAASPLAREARLLEGWALLRSGAVDRGRERLAAAAAMAPYRLDDPREFALHLRALEELAASSLPPHAAGADSGWGKLLPLLAARPRLVPATPRLLLLRGELLLERERIGEAEAALDSTRRRAPGQNLGPRLEALALHLEEARGLNADSLFKRRYHFVARTDPGWGSGPAGAALDSLLAKELFGAAQLAVRRALGEGRPHWVARLDRAALLFGRRFPRDPRLLDLALNLEGVHLRFASAVSADGPGEGWLRQRYRTGLALHPDHPRHREAASRLAALALEELEELHPADPRPDTAIADLQPFVTRYGGETAAEVRQRAARLLLRGGEPLAAEELLRPLLVEGRGSGMRRVERLWRESLLATGDLELAANAARLLRLRGGVPSVRIAAEAVQAQVRYLKTRRRFAADPGPDEAKRFRAHLDSLEGPVNTPELLFDAGVLLTDLGYPEQAQELFFRVARRHGDSPWSAPAAHNAAALAGDRGAGGLQRARGEGLEAARSHEHAWELDPDGPWAVHHLSEAAANYRAADRPRDELAAVERLLERHGGEVEPTPLRLRAGRLALRLGEPDVARAHLQRAAELSPRSRDALEAHALLAAAAPDSARCAAHAGRVEELVRELRGVGSPTLAALARYAHLRHRVAALAPGKGAEMDSAGTVRTAITLHQEALELVRTHPHIGVAALLATAKLDDHLAAAAGERARRPGGTPEAQALRYDRHASTAAAHLANGVRKYAVAADEGARVAEEARDGEGADPVLPGLAFLLGVDPDRDGEELARELRRRALDGFVAIRFRHARLLADRLRAWTALPDSGATPHQRLLYRQTLLDELVRPRLEEAATVSADALITAERHGRLGELATPLDSLLDIASVSAARAADRARGRAGGHMEELAAFAAAGDPEGGVQGATTEQVSGEVMSLLDRSVELTRLRTGLWRDGLLAAAYHLEEGRISRLARQLLARAPLPGGHDSLAALAVRIREEGRRRADRSGQALFLSVSYDGEDLLRAVRDAEAEELAALWDFAEAWGGRPGPKADRIVRRLAVLRPARYAPLLGLESTPHQHATGGEGWVLVGGEGERLSPEWGPPDGEWPRHPAPRYVSGQHDQRLQLHFTVDGLPSGARLLLTGDQPWVLEVNGEFAGEGAAGRGRGRDEVDLEGMLRPGRNRISLSFHPAEGSPWRIAALLHFDTWPPVTSRMRVLAEEEMP